MDKPIYKLNISGHKELSEEHRTANVWLRGLISTKTRNPTRGNVKSGVGQTELQAEYLQNKEQGTANVWLRGLISS